MISRRSLLAATAALPLLAACGTTGAATKRAGGRLRAAFVGSSTSTPSPLTATYNPLDYVRAKIVWDELGYLDDSFTPVWHLAESVEHNGDATTWRIRLRRGVTFSDGRTVTADDVLFSLRSLAEKGGGQGPLLTEVDWGASRAAGPGTASIALKNANAAFDLALTQSMIVFPDGTVDFDHAVGSGPYVHHSHTPGRGAVLRPNPHHWRGRPHLEELELVAIADAGTRLNALKAGQIDYASAVPLSAARAERENPAIRLVIPEKAAWADHGLALNLRQKPFTDIRVAQALRYAVDRDAMVRVITMGFGEVANDLFGKHQRHYAADIPQRVYDPDRAKRLLTEAGLSGLTVRLRTSDFEPGMLEGAVAIAEQAKAAGITLRLDRIPAADYYADMKTVLSAPAQSASHLPRPIPTTALYYHDRAAAFPLMGRPSERTADLAGRLRTATTEDRRATAIAELQRHLHEHGGEVLYVRSPQIAAVTPGVHGVEARGYAAYPSFADATTA